MDIEIFNAEVNGEGLRIGIVQARFNEPICNALREACLAELERLGVSEEDVLVCTVPGALEVPLALRQLAHTAEFDALIALGAVVRGETYHFEVVSDQSAAGIMQLTLDYGVPIANAILTVDTDEQAHARTREKGTDAARVAVEMANLSASLSGLTEDDDDEEDDDE
ncbi:MAG: 6,7-dimethyl-8-ribityllumazine synthase [Burkholderiales bacterium]|nr:6,7-dimethyl-8-ribityllumazine synthase [Burkholderiales bacterium]